MSALTVKHDYISCNGAEAFAGNKEAIICIGTTKTGKSSLINLFCGGKVAIGHGVESKTPESTLYASYDSNNKYWLDSQGANDSQGAADEKVLKDALRKVHDQKVNKIKVIWTVDSGELLAKKDEYQTQSKFIKSLGDDIWKSCLIIKKRGRPQPKQMKGVLAAANECGAEISATDTRLFGFTGIQYNNDNSEDATLELINETKDDNERNKKLQKYGYLTNQQIKSEISRKLSNLPSFVLEFEAKKCTKCSAKGDPRFIYALCHANIEWYHWGSPNDNYEWYHPGDREDVQCESTGYYVAEGIFTLGIGSLVRAAQDDYTYRRWSCCKKMSYSAQGCESRIGSSKYSCCGASTSDSGCGRRCQQCHRSVGSDGCIKTNED